MLERNLSSQQQKQQSWDETPENLRSTGAWGEINKLAKNVGNLPKPDLKKILADPIQANKWENQELGSMIKEKQATLRHELKDLRVAAAINLFEEGLIEISANIQNVMRNPQRTESQKAKIIGNWVDLLKSAKTEWEKMAKEIERNPAIKKQLAAKSNTSIPALLEMAQNMIDKTKPDTIYIDKNRLDKIEKDYPLIKGDPDSYQRYKTAIEQFVKDCDTKLADTKFDPDKKIEVNRLKTLASQRISGATNIY